MAFLLADGFDNDQVTKVKQALTEKGAKVKIVSKFLGTLKGKNGEEIEVDKNHVTTASIMYDAIFIPGGKGNLEQLMMQGDAIHFVNEAFKHHKPIAASGEGVGLLIKSEIKGIKFSESEGDDLVADKGVVTTQAVNDLNSFSDQFIKAIVKHRHWEREEKGMVPA
ncbi:MAG: DJ-1/PfpI family protein [Bacteroidota bacterium]|nr:DJ-1/PfpI family protein [Bacteroidota bacterium]